MDNRQWKSGASATPPTAPVTPSVGYPSPGDPGMGVAATKGGAFWFHQIGEELRAILTAASITPDHTDLSQLLSAINILAEGKTIGRNVVVNGGCEISQVSGSTLITPTNVAYPIDNMQIELSAASKLQTQQKTNVLNSLGAVNAIEFSVLTAYTPAATDVMDAVFPIEGVNFARFQYGSANAKAGSLQFKARASIAGTYSGVIANYAFTRCYPFTFTLEANVDTLVKIENIPGDTAGAWVGATNAGAAYICFDLGGGVDRKAAAGAWASGAYRGATGALNFAEQVAGSTLAITDVQFEVGTLCTQYERKLYDQVLSECQRYLPYFTNPPSEVYAVGYSKSTTEARAMLTLTTRTRVAVTGMVTVGGTVALTDAAGTPQGSVAAVYASPMVIHVYANTGTYTAGQGSQLYGTGNSAIYFTGAQI